MILKDYFLAQLDREAASTRKAIDRFPEGHSDFKPHPRSMEFGYMASVVASMIGWIASSSIATSSISTRLKAPSSALSLSPAKPIFSLVSTPLSPMPAAHSSPPPTSNWQSPGPSR